MLKINSKKCFTSTQYIKCKFCHFYPPPSPPNQHGKNSKQTSEQAHNSYKVTTIKIGIFRDFYMTSQKVTTIK